MKATVLDLRYRTKDILKAVERGETVTVLYRGKEKARILPPLPQANRKDVFSDKGFAIWKDRQDMRNPAAYVREMRKGRFSDL